MFSIRAKQRPIHSISASDSSKFQFHICFRSFRPDFLSVFHGEDTVSPNMWNKVNELSCENLPQQQIVTSSFHQCQQGFASSQCQCHNSNILVNANSSYPTVTQSHNTKSLIHHPPKKRSHQGSAYPNIKHYRTIASFMQSTM